MEEWRFDGIWTHEESEQMSMEVTEGKPGRAEKTACIERTMQRLHALKEQCRVNRKTLLNKLCQALTQVNNIPCIGN